MKDSDSRPENALSLETGIEQGQAISLDEAGEIAGEVRDLISAGREDSAWDLIRHLHPADIGVIVAGLPRTSRDTMVGSCPPPRWPGCCGR